jgi:hypothetical protein
MMHGLEAARSRALAWDADRQARVLQTIQKTRGTRAARSRAISIALSSIVCTMILAFVVRAFGSAPAQSTHDHSPIYAMDDGGREN